MWNSPSVSLRAIVAVARLSPSFARIGIDIAARRKVVVPRVVWISRMIAVHERSVAAGVAVHYMHTTVRTRAVGKAT